MKASLIIPIIGLLSAVAYGQEVSSTSGKYALTCPDDWKVRNFPNTKVVVALVSPKENEQDDFNENVVVMSIDKTEGSSLKTVAESEDKSAKAKRSDFKVSDEKAIKIDGHDAICRVCTMTFPEFVSKNRQYIVDTGSEYLTLTCSVPEAKFEQYDAVMKSICESLRVK